ncbi:MAG: dockerin type I repeat-containing protein [candidate division Zixibacteria bacterium]
MGKYQFTVRLFLAAIVMLMAGFLLAADEGGYSKNSEDKVSLNDQTILPGDPRKVAVHDAGKFYTTIYETNIGLNGAGNSVDPETGELLKPLTYPKGSDLKYAYVGSLWIGGVADSDSFVTVGDDGWIGDRELFPEDYIRGNTYRTGNYADDEFISTVVDTFYGSEGPTFYHRPLGLEVVHRTYSWSDPLYDDFVIMEYTITNIQDKNITDGWAGIFLDADVNHISFNQSGYMDDCAGTLEVGLNDNVPSQKSLIAYIMDNDGDPIRSGGELVWDYRSPRGAISVRLLEASFDVERINFNWWCSSGNPDDGIFGPRQLGNYWPSPSASSYWRLDQRKYDDLSYPEIDYNQLETNLFDTTNGWRNPPVETAIDVADGCDTRFLLSFGPFDLPPGDSVTFAVALVAADNVHANPDDFANFYEMYDPIPFEKSLDFSELILHHRRAEQVYKSGLKKPTPGPPQGMKIVDYDDDYVDLTWNASIRPDLAGYNLYSRDKTYNGEWQKFNSYLMMDTICRFDVPYSTNEYDWAVSLSDRRHRESGLSLPVSLTPARPHPVKEFSISVIDAVPVLSWTPSVDSANVEFVVYRGERGDSLYPYDLTSEHSYRDYNVVSGDRYYYSVAVKNELGLESLLSDILYAIPMAMNEGILLCDFNGWSHSQTGPFYTSYLETLYNNALSRLPSRMEMYDRFYHTINEFADYNILIFDSESRWNLIDPRAFDDLRTYFDGGGKAIIISSIFRSPSDETITWTFDDNDFFKQYLKLDGLVTNALVFDGAYFYGDLMGCASLHSDYEDILADTAKLTASQLPISGYIPMTGYLIPTEEAEPIYSYISSDADTVHHGAVNGIRYLGDDYQFVLLNFPLTLMDGETAVAVLHRALMDMGIDVLCGDANGDNRTDVADAVTLLHYLFRGGSPPSDEAHADVDCDGEIVLADAIMIINFIFRDGALLKCCQN